jgi:hypothetical protein
VAAQVPEFQIRRDAFALVRLFSVTQLLLYYDSSNCLDCTIALSDEKISELERKFILLIPLSVSGPSFES